MRGARAQILAKSSPHIEKVKRGRGDRICQRADGGNLAEKGSPKKEATSKAPVSSLKKHRSEYERSQGNCWDGGMVS